MNDKTTEATKCDGAVFHADDNTEWECSLPAKHDGDCAWSGRIEEGQISKLMNDTTKLPNDRKLIERIADEIMHPANQYDPAENLEGALKFHKRTAERILRVIAEQSGDEKSNYTNDSLSFKNRKFEGELRFIQFASYNDSGPAIMVYTPEAWEASERGDNPGPIGFIPISALVIALDEWTDAQFEQLQERTESGRITVSVNRIKPRDGRK